MQLCTCTLNVASVSIAHGMPRGMPHRAAAATCPCTHAADTRARRACQPAPSAEDHSWRSALSRASTVAQTHSALGCPAASASIASSASENMALSRGVHHKHNDTRELSRTVTEAQSEIVAACRVACCMPHGCLRCATCALCVACHACVASVPKANGSQSPNT